MYEEMPILRQSGGWRAHVLASRRVALRELPRDQERRGEVVACAVPIPWCLLTKLTQTRGTTDGSIRLQVSRAVAEWIENTERVNVDGRWCTIVNCLSGAEVGAIVFRSPRVAHTLTCEIDIGLSTHGKGRLGERYNAVISMCVNLIHCPRYRQFPVPARAFCPLQGETSDYPEKPARQDGVAAPRARQSR